MSNENRAFDMDGAAEFVGKKRRTLELWLKETGIEPDFLEPTGKSRPKAMYSANTLRELMRKKGVVDENTDAETEVVDAETVSETIAVTEQETGLARVELPSFNGDLSVFVGVIAQAVAQSLRQQPKDSIADLAVMPFLTFHQAHRLYNVPEQHLRDAVKAGELRAIKQGRGQQIRAKDVLAWRDAKFDQ